MHITLYQSVYVGMDPSSDGSAIASIFKLSQLRYDQISGDHRKEEMFDFINRALNIFHLHAETYWQVHQEQD